MRGSVRSRERAVRPEELVALSVGLLPGERHAVELALAADRHPGRNFTALAELERLRAEEILLLVVAHMIDVTLQATHALVGRSTMSGG